MHHGPRTSGPSSRRRPVPILFRSARNCSGPSDFSRPVTDAAPTDAALVVRLGADRWSIPVAAVIEVLRGQTLTRVPGADPVVLGLVNHRGRVLTVGDPARALGVADA